MLAKPSSCAGCPLYGDGNGFVPDELRPGAAVMIVGHPDQRITDFHVDKHLKDAGLGREDVSMAMALRCKSWQTLDPPSLALKTTKDALAHCWRAHGKIPEGTRLIVAQGDYAAVTLTGGTVTDGDKSTGWRGYLRPSLHRGGDQRGPGSLVEPWVPQMGVDLPVLLTVHLARLFREPWYTLPTRLDWAKIPRILAGKWPRKPPRFNLEAPKAWPEAFAFDTEFWHEDGHAPTTARLIRWSASWGTGDGETCVVEAAQAGMGQSQRSSMGTPLRDSLLGPPRVITQYAPADVHHLAALSGMNWRDTVWDQFLIEDTVWKHAVLHSDFAHDLNFLASCYGSFNRHKHLSESNPILYSALDATVLWEVDRALERELTADPLSRRVWETIDRPALGEFVRAQYRGLRVNPERVREVLARADSAAQDAELRAQAVAGWPISLASNPQVGHQLYEIEGLKPKR